MPGEEKSGNDSSLVNIKIGEDALGLGKSTKILVDAIVAGIGPLLEPWSRSRIARSDQAAARGWLELAKEAGLDLQSFDLSTREGRADVRLLAEKERHQQAREADAFASLSEAQVLISEGVASDEPRRIEPEWLHRFWRLAQDISSDDLQSLWGRVLARQALGSGAVSARTLEALGLLDGEEIAALTHVAAMVCDTRPGELRDATIISSVDDGTLSAERREIGDRLQNLILPFDPSHFASVGLLRGNEFGYSLTVAVPPDMPIEIPLWIAGARFIIRGPKSSGPEPKADIGEGWGLSQLGLEIIELIKTEPSDAYVRTLAEGLRLSGMTLSKGE